MHAKLIELTAVYDSEHTSVSEFSPVPVMVDISLIETVLSDPIDPKRDGTVRGCRITLRPGIAEYGEGDEIAQGQRMIISKESYESIREVLRTERGVVSVVD